MSPPMQPLVNTCRWSSSRESTLNECRKKYWYTYYGSWEGWPLTPYDERKTVRPLAATLYRLKNIQPLCVFLGTVVHKVIEQTLKAFMATKKMPTKDFLIQETLALFHKGLSDSQKQLWKQHPKKYTNIAEHYFNMEIAHNEEEAAAAKACSCISHWIDSPCVRNLLMHPNARILGTESIHTFQIKENLEAIVVYDLYMEWPQKDGSSTMIIFDWKTGKESRKIEEQLLAYAIAARTLFSLPLKNIILSPFYLAEGPSGYKKYGVNQPHAITEEQLAYSQAQCIAAAETMIALHPIGAYVCPDPRTFPYTEDRRKCRRCQYQAICQTASYRPLSCDELEQCDMAAIP